MSIKTKTIKIQTYGIKFYDLNEYINKFLKETKVTDGLLNIFIKHTSASVVITENYDYNVKKDILNFLQKTIPFDDNYLHNTEGEDDMPAHIKSIILPQSLTIPIKNGYLDLGTWQSIYLLEHRTSKHIREIELTIFY